MSEMRTGTAQVTKHGVSFRAQYQGARPSAQRLWEWKLSGVSHLNGQPIERMLLSDEGREEAETAIARYEKRQAKRATRKPLTEAQRLAIKRRETEILYAQAVAS